jgi:hypothetical protein
MNLFTSNFAVAGKHPKAVCIAVGKPFWWKGRNYPALAPTREMLKMSSEDYLILYNEILAKLDPEKVVEELGDGAVMLCWCNVAKGEKCHRRLVSGWLEREAGIVVPEFTPRTVEQLSLPFLQ